MKTRVVTAVCGLLLTAGMSFGQRVRAVHASPDAPAVDIYVDGQKGLSGLPFGEYSDYVAVGVGQRNLALFVAGTTTKVLERNLSVGSGADYTVIATGYAGGGTPALQIIALQDQPGQTTEGKAKVRVVHAAPAAPAVDVYWTSPFLALEPQLPVLTGVPFGAASGYLSVPAGPRNAQYQARVALAGTKTVAIDSGRLVVPSEGVRTYVAVEMWKDGAPTFYIIELLDRN